MTTAALTTVGGWVAQAAIQTSFDILSSLAIPQSYPDLNDALRSLNTSLSKANAILAVSHKMKVDDHLTQLLKQLKESVYDASDLLGELQYEELKLKVEGKEDHLGGLLTNAFEFLSDLLKDAPGKVRGVQKSLDEIASAIGEVVNISLFVGEKQQPETAQGRDPTSSFLLDPEVFGRDEDLGMLTELLLKPDEGSQSSNKVVVPVISLVGMGGVGKTTLAQLAYSELEEKFEENIWICASDPFDVKRLTREIVETVDKDNSTLTQLDRLQKIVMKKLASKRFLLVIDDVWNEDGSKWEKFYAPLRLSAPGSKILVTTRSLKVAEAIKSMYKMPLEGLSEDDYYSFFKKCAFGNKDSKNYPRLEEIGKKIAGKLKGIPLAAKTLGSLLNRELNRGLNRELIEEQWKTVMESEIWDLMQKENDILPVLKLSYDYLPPCLKQCFAYCSLFPKDFKFEKDTLVQMWMAQGFIITSQKNLLMEDVGRGYVKDLLSRGLFEQVAYDDGEMIMHDLLHDLAQSISKDECYRIDDGNKAQKIPHTVYHLSVCDEYLEPHMIIDICNKHKKLRTLLFVCYATRDLLSVEELDQLLCGLTCMRVLVLQQHSVTFDELPDGIGDLKQLRYLDVFFTNVHKLPESLCRLYNLQVLKLDPEYEVSFPKGVTNLISLRHLSAKESSVIMIANIGRLTSLQNLSLFSIRKKHGYMIEEVKNMIELRGNLRIEHLENIDSKEEASKAKLDNKMYLKELWLEWADERHTDLGIEISDAVILEGLRPHSNLEELNIVNYGGQKCPSWLESQFLSNLVSISLINCKHMEWSGAYGSHLFPCLKKVSIRRCPKLRNLPFCLPPSLVKLKLKGVGLDVLPGIWVGSNVSEESSSSNSYHQSASLSRVDIRNCPNLKSLEEFLLPNQLTALRSMTIEDCGELTSLPIERFKDLSGLVGLKLKNCPKLTYAVEAAGEEEQNNDLLFPSSLRIVTLGCCGDLDRALLLCLRGATSLGSLEMADCEHITSFPREYDMTKLEDLKLKGLTELKTLDYSSLRCFTYLKGLRIKDCPQLKAIPEDSLPSSLRLLDISNCHPDLKERCQKDTGDDWPKIAHIRSIYIDGNRINC